MSLEIRILNLGIAATNAYIIGDAETGEAVLIDPVDNAPLLQRTAQDAGLTIKWILATHAHFDHVLASHELKELTGAPFWIHAEAAPFLDLLPESGVRFTGTPFPEAATPDRLLTTEPETLTLGTITLDTLYTPGHAPGHLSFYMPDHGIVFSGDALFKGSIGRTDLPGGDLPLLMTSMADKLLTLDRDTQILPGHGQPTTIGEERATNPFIRDYLHLAHRR